ncbi:MAG: DUF5915 domain-containing protein, partial [Ignavibacteriaceae bacterium]|nr:DUF5915 domain-containing protein [Ignavibacteriaceae bacterium]
ATRWYLVFNSPPWRPTLFDEESLAETQRKFFGTLMNTYSFFALYANIDGFKFKEALLPYEDRPEIDRWIISKLNSVVSEFEGYMESYDVTKAVRLVSSFTIDQLSNWYVRRSRRRFWKSEMNIQKLSAYQTLYECLNTIAKLISPFTPFLAEELYQNLNNISKKEEFDSVHLSYFPELTFTDKSLESKMEIAQNVVYITRAMRAKLNLKVRQPLKKIMVVVADDKKDALTQMQEVILEELNIKELVVLADDSGIVNKSAKPNFKSIGPKFGKIVNPVANAIRSFGKDEIKSLEEGTEISLNLNGVDVLITLPDVEIISSEITGWSVESQDGVTVALDTELSEELILEGLAREFVNRVQNMRKDAGFEVTDRIRINFSADETLFNAINQFNDYIANETLAESVNSVVSEEGFIQDWNINDLYCKISIEKLIS